MCVICFSLSVSVIVCVCFLVFVFYSIWVSWQKTHWWRWRIESERHVVPDYNVLNVCEALHSLLHMFGGFKMHNSIFPYVMKMKLHMLCIVLCTSAILLDYGTLGRVLKIWVWSWKGNIPPCGSIQCHQSVKLSGFQDLFCCSVKYRFLLSLKLPHLFLICIVTFCTLQNDVQKPPWERNLTCCIQYNKYYRWRDQ